MPSRFPGLLRVLPLGVAAAALLLAVASPAAAASPLSPVSGPDSGGTTVTFAAGADGFTQVAAGQDNSFGLDADGQVYAWGANSQGQLGDGTTTNRTVPVRLAAGAIPAGVTITQVAAAYSDGYALGSDGHVYGWGANGAGQVGDGTTTNRLTPVQVALPVTATAIAGGGSGGYALGSDGHVYAWGSNFGGQLGDGTTTNRSTPVQVLAGAIPAGVTISSIAAGDANGYVIGSDGHVYSWGIDGEGELGDGATTDQHAPVATVAGAIAGGVTITAVAGQQEGAYALGSDGHVYSWGYNGLNELGDGTTANASSPVQVLAGAVPSGVRLTTIAASSASGFSIGSDGHVYTWGYNSSGQLGDGTNTDRSAPVQAQAGVIPAGVTITSMAGGYHYALALGSDGVEYGWGQDPVGEIGDGGTADQFTPVLGVHVTTTGATFGGIAATSFTASGAAGSVVTPAHSAGAVDVALTGTIAAGTTATTLTAVRTMAGAFTYTAPQVATAELAATGVAIPWMLWTAALMGIALGAGLLVAAGMRRRRL